MKQKTKVFKQKDLSKNIKNLTLLSASLPILMIALINTISAPINTFIVSGVNKNAVESIGTAGSILFLFGVLISLVVGGSSIIIGQYIGAKGKEEDLKKATHTTFFLMLFMSLFLVTTIMALSRVFLKAYGIKNEKMLYDGSLYILSIAPTQILGVMQQYYIGTLSIYGHPKHALYIGLTVTFGDILLSLLFVYWLHLGVIGVIVGTIIARVVGFIFSFISYSLILEPAWLIRQFDWKTAKKIIKISFPIAGERVNYNATMFVLGILIGNIAVNVGFVKYDHNYMIWARAIYNSSTSIVLIGGIAFSVGLERVLSRNYGANKIDESKNLVIKAFFFALAIDIPIALILFFTQNYIIDFLTAKEKNPKAVTMLKNILYSTYGWLFLLEIGRISNLIFIAATRSAGDTKVTALFSISSSWLVVILFGWVLADPLNLGWEGIMIAMTTDEVIRGIFNFSRWKIGKWKKHIKKISGNINNK